MGRVMTNRAATVRERISSTNSERFLTGAALNEASQTRPKFKVGAALRFQQRSTGHGIGFVESEHLQQHWRDVRQTASVAQSATA